MQSFKFYSPTEVVFGKGAELQVADEIKRFGGNRVFILYGGGSVVKSGLLARIEKSLADAGLAYQSMGGVKPNPRLSFAREAIKVALEFRADFILAVGGGSVIDTSKAVAHGIATPEIDIWKYWKGLEKIQRSTPVGAVLTISAAGSETSDSAVLTDEESGEKIGMGNEFNRPRFAIMNPELTYTLPRYQIGCGIVDIMMHTLDRYFTPTDGNETTDQIAEAILRVTIANGRVAIDHPTDYDAMSELMWCGSLSHNHLTGLGAVADFTPHMMGHELSGMFDVAHGASLSTLWGSWAVHTWKVKPSRFVRFAKNVWGIEKATEEEAALAGIEATVNYFKSLDMPTCFTELGIGIQSDEVLHELAERATFYGKRKVGHLNEMDAAETYEVYKLANR